MLDERISELQKHQADMLRFVNRMEDSALRTLLISYYINNHSFAVTAEAMNYSEKWVRTALHSQALKSFEKVFTEI